MANINPAEHKQSTTRTPQTISSDCPHKRAGMLTRRLPTAVATNHPPIIIPLYLGGATFDTNEMPIGDNSNSANVRMKYVEISQFSDTRTAASPAAFCVAGSD